MAAKGARSKAVAQLKSFESRNNDTRVAITSIEGEHSEVLVALVEAG